jgi:hypothetical protein
MYVLGADSSDLSVSHGSLCPRTAFDMLLTFQKVYIYDFAGDAWSTQSTTSPPSNLGSRSGSVLDHDTNVVFTLPTGGGGMYQLDMSSVTKSASGSAVAWEAVTNPSFDAGSYQTTMAQASNHISESLFTD